MQTRVKDKIIRLLKALSNESVKRLPYIILVGLILIFIQFVHLNNKTAQSVRVATGNSIDTKTLLKRVAALSEDNKKLTQQNLDIAKQNAAHLDCVANLFAQYTRDQRPIYDIDLDKCFIQESAQMSATISPSVSRQSLISPVAPSSKPTPKTVQGLSNTPQPVPHTPSFFEKLMSRASAVLQKLGL